MPGTKSTALASATDWIMFPSYKFLVTSRPEAFGSGVRPLGLLHHKKLKCVERNFTPKVASTVIQNMQESAKNAFSTTAR